MIINAGPGGYLEVVSLVTALPKASQTTALSLLSIPPPFAPTLASFLNLRSRFDVKELGDIDMLSPGRCYLGTGGTGLEFGVAQGRVVIRKPSNPIGEANTDSFDRLLNSAAELYNDHVVVVLLSGAELGSMQGLDAVRTAGGSIIAPEFGSCILPATLEPAQSAGLISDTFNLMDVREMLERYCV
jgi:two-component system chemotaxis response regulator CheB